MFVLSRPQKCRRICKKPDYCSFYTEGTDKHDCVLMTEDEYEVIRLVDYENKTHAQCSDIINISRTTVSEIYELAHKKLADFIVNGKQLVITGGNTCLCNGAAEQFCGKKCLKKLKSKGEFQNEKS